MLNRLPSGARRRIAALLVVFYAVCVLSPMTALAFADTPKTVHCLTEVSNGLAHLHGDGHADDVSHLHVDADAPGHSVNDENHKGKSDDRNGLKARGIITGRKAISKYAP